VKETWNDKPRGPKKLSDLKEEPEEDKKRAKKEQVLFLKKK